MKYLAIQLYIMRHVFNVYFDPRTLCGEFSLFIKEQYLTFWLQNQDIYYKIDITTYQYIEELEIFEIDTPTNSEVWNTLYINITTKARVLIYISMD